MLRIESLHGLRGMITRPFGQAKGEQSVTAK